MAKIKKYLCILLVALIFMSAGGTAFAENLVDKFLIVDEQGISVGNLEGDYNVEYKGKRNKEDMNTKGQYYVVIEGMKADVVYEKEIQMQNLYPKETLSLYMMAEPQSTYGFFEECEETSGVLKVYGFGETPPDDGKTYEPHTLRKGSVDKVTSGFGMTPVPDSELAGVFAGAVPTGIVVYRRVYTIPGDRPEDTVHKYQYKVYKKLGEDVYQYVEPTGYSDDGNRQGAKITGLSYKFKNILPFDMFEICTITLSVDGKEFYRGSPDGNGSINMQEEAYHLGAFESGGQKIMKMTAVMDGSKLPGAAYEGEIEFWWIFNAERALPPDETTTADDDETTTGEDEEKTTDKDKTTAKTTEKDSGPDGTKTGVQFNTALYIIAGSIALAMAVVYVLILVYKKRGEKQEEIEDVLNR